MAKKAASGKSLVIVESPAKARTISKFLGRGYTVEASIGHIRDLPQGSKELPAEFKKEKWAYLGVNVDDNFTPVYIIPPGKKQQVAKLKALLKDCDQLYLATDEDREGEAISWHLVEVLRPKVPIKRLVFHEITDEAIHDALATFDGPIIEVHLSNPNAREPWRHTSVIAPVATGSIVGFKGGSYGLAGHALKKILG